MFGYDHRQQGLQVYFLAMHRHKKRSQLQTMIAVCVFMAYKALYMLTGIRQPIYK